MTAQQIVTFVFSDIEQSTRLAQRLQERYPAVLERHRSVIRSAISQYNGQEINTAGDGFFMAFENLAAAVRAAGQIQKEFHKAKWATDIGLKVRIGIHTGRALQTSEGYTGVDVHFAARVCDAAFGGQVMLSHDSQRCLETSGGVEGYALTSLGKHSLKDFPKAVELFELHVPGISHRFLKSRNKKAEKRIAVLPFAVASPDAAYEYVGEGIAEELIVALGKVCGLRVLSRSTAFALKKGNWDARKVGEKFQVAAVLQGRIKVANGRIRVSVELTDAHSGLNLWSELYEENRQQLLKLQEEIVHKIIGSLECGLIPGQLNSIQKRQSHIAEAYDYYLRGRRFYLQFSARGTDLALRMFEKAIEADETYALAYAGIADCFSFLYQHKLPSQETIDKAASASEKAIALAPDLAEVYVSRGIVLGLQGQFEASEQAFRYAIERDPTLFLGWFQYGRMCFAAGKLEQAAYLFEQANRVEPDNYQSVLLSAQMYSRIGCHDLAKTLRKRGVELAENCVEFNPGDTRALYFAANALVSLDQREKSLRFLEQALLLEPKDSMLLYNAGCIYALLGMKQEALNCLEKSYDAGLMLRSWYENDSDLDSLRSEPRFVALLERMVVYPG